MLAPVALALAVAATLAWRLPGSGIRDPGSEVRGSLTFARFFRDVAPLGLGVLLSALYFRIDLYFIERWHGLEAVGGYNAVFRLVEAARLLPAAVMAVTFPLLVNATNTGLVRRIGGWLTLVGAALAIMSAAGANVIVTTIYGVPYGYTAPVFAILSLALPLFFLNYALTHQVIGWDGQRAYLSIAAAALVANIAANLMLVPTRGIAGAAIATVVTEIVVTAGCAYVLWRRTVGGDTPAGWSRGSRSSVGVEP